MDLAIWQSHQPSSLDELDKTDEEARLGLTSADQRGEIQSDPKHKAQGSQTIVLPCKG